MGEGAQDIDLAILTALLKGESTLSALSMLRILLSKALILFLFKNVFFMHVF